MRRFIQAIALSTGLATIAVAGLELAMAPLASAAEPVGSTDGGGLCGTHAELGVWWNQTRDEAPAKIEIVMTGCYETLSARVWTTASDGSLFYRGEFPATETTPGGKVVVSTSVPLGGYVERLKMERTYDSNRRAWWMRVSTVFESLDSKPSHTAADARFDRTAPPPPPVTDVQHTDGGPSAAPKAPVTDIGSAGGGFRLG